MKMSDDWKAIIAISMVLLLAITLVMGVFFLVGYAWNSYDVWAQGMQGKAELAKADWNRQITVREAQAKFEAAKSLAEAEIERAKGIAKANEIIGQSLQNNEAYLRYLWIDSLAHTNNQTIYVPTEANLPILEASRKPNDKTVTEGLK